MSKRKVFLVTSNDPWEVVALGFAGENLARTVEWDIGPWVETYGEGEVQLLAKRPVDKNPYPVVVARDGDSVLWMVRKEDLWDGNEEGRAQLFYLVDGQVVARSKAFRTMTREAIEGDVQECSEPERDWVEQVLQSVASAEESAGAAGEASKAAEESARQAVEAEERLQQTIEETAVAAAENAANAAVEKATQVAGGAADSAVESAEDAAGSAGVAGEKAEEAGKSAEAAAKSAEAAGLAEEKAGTYAGQAEESAADAKEQVDAAAKSAELANQSAGRAEDAATQAAESAEAAAGDAADAKESADDAADSALSAAESAEMAQAYSGKPPVITDDIWYVWDAETDAYLSTGKPSRGEQGLTGPQGAAGPKGDTGEAAGFGVPVATVENSVGVPEVTVSASGPDTAKVFSFAFSGIKGEPGAQGPQGAKGEPGIGVGSIVRTAGNGAAGTTDTYTMYNDEGEEIGSFEVYNGANGDGAGDFMANGSVAMTGELDAGGNRICNVGEPVDNGDVPSKEYVDQFAIQKTASGETIVLKDSAACRLRSFRLYGKSIQDGLPTPESPAEFQSAGDSGSIMVALSDGGIQSKVFTFPTPNGLPGIPVEDGGNYTDGDGQQWYCDIVDLSSGVYLQNVEYINAKDKKWRVNVSWSNINGNCVLAYYVTDATYISHVLSNKLKAVTYSAGPGPYKEYEITVEKQINANKSVIYISIPLTAVGEATNEALAAYLESADIYMVIPKRETIQGFDRSTIIGDNHLTIYKPNTIIMTDEEVPAGISVEYIADPKTYIDQKYNDLQKQLDILIGAEA